VLNARHGRGYFAAVTDRPERLVFLVQSFLCIASLTFLAMAAVLQEPQQALADLAAANPRAEASRALLRTLSDNAPAGVAFLDTELRFQHLNQKLADINARALEDHIGRKVEEVVPHLWPALEPHYHRVLTTGQAIPEIELVGEVASMPGQ